MHRALRVAPVFLTSVIGAALLCTYWGIFLVVLPSFCMCCGSIHGNPLGVAGRQCEGEHVGCGALWSTVYTWSDALHKFAKCTCLDVIRVGIAKTVQFMHSLRAHPLLSVYIQSSTAQADGLYVQLWMQWHALIPDYSDA